MSDFADLLERFALLYPDWEAQITIAGDGVASIVALAYAPISDRIPRYVLPAPAGDVERAVHVMRVKRPPVVTHSPWARSRSEAQRHAPIADIEHHHHWMAVTFRPRSTRELFARWTVDQHGVDHAAGVLLGYLRAVNWLRGCLVVPCVDCGRVGPFHRANALPQCGQCTGLQHMR